MKARIIIFICLGLASLKVCAQREDILWKFDNYEEFQMSRLAHKAKKLVATSYGINESYGRLDSSKMRRNLAVRPKTLSDKPYNINNSVNDLYADYYEATRISTQMPLEKKVYYGKFGVDSIVLYRNSEKVAVICIYNILPHVIRSTTLEVFGKNPFNRKKTYRGDGLIDSDTQTDRKGNVVEKYYDYDYKGRLLNVRSNLMTGNSHYPASFYQRNDSSVTYYDLDPDSALRYKVIYYDPALRKQNKSYQVEHNFEITYNSYGQEMEWYHNVFKMGFNFYRHKRFINYDKNLVTSVRGFHDRGEIDSLTYYKWDDKGRLTEQIFARPDAHILLQKTTYKYDGCPIPSESNLYWEDEIFENTKFILSEDCKVIGKKVTFLYKYHLEADDTPDRPVISFKTVYDDRGRFVSEKRIESFPKTYDAEAHVDTVYKIELKYKKDKLINTFINYGSQIKELTFDKNEDLVSIIYNKRREILFNYKYDKNGNWIEMTKTEINHARNTEPETKVLLNTITQREITY